MGSTGALCTLLSRPAAPLAPPLHRGPVLGAFQLIEQITNSQQSAATLLRVSRQTQRGSPPPGVDP